MSVMFTVLCLDRSTSLYISGVAFTIPSPIAAGSPSSDTAPAVAVASSAMTVSPVFAPDCALPAAEPHPARMVAVIAILSTIDNTFFFIRISSFYSLLLSPKGYTQFRNISL